MKELNGGNNLFSLSGLSTGATLYTEISGGYSHKINEHWTIGGKLKVLLGTAYVGINSKKLDINASTEEWRLQGDLGITMASAPILDNAYLAGYISDKDASQIIDGIKSGAFDASQLIDTSDPRALILNAIRPAGYGAALDFGFAWKPIEQLQVSLGLTDLGFIYWTNASQYKCTVDTFFNGVGNLEYSDYLDENGKFSTQMLTDSVTNNMMGLLSGFRMSTSSAKGFARMTSARLNIKTIPN